jgi:cell division protein ZapA
LKTIGVSILGRTYSIRSEDDEGYIQRLSAYINEKIEALQGKGTAPVPLQNLAILAALNVADELFKERARYDSLKQKIRTKSTLLLEKMDQSRSP